MTSKTLIFQTSKTGVKFCDPFVSDIVRSPLGHPFHQAVGHWSDREPVDEYAITAGHVHRVEAMAETGLLSAIPERWYKKSVHFLTAFRFRSLFAFNEFNPVQTECFDTAFYSDKNMVIAAPTGSGL